ncbi:MAG TPA: MATE family efflux transporter [Acholeplasmataceae bacterium]|nr:MATE family efflux transporter [Acholeplasmataceae bacterium]
MSLLLSSKLKKDNKKPLPKISTLIANTLKISLPAAIETLFIGLIGMADTMMVGNYSTEALSAVAISQQPVMITIAAAIGINAGVIAIISRRKGENNKEAANDCLRQSLIIGFIVSIVMTFIALAIANPLLRLAGAKDETIGLAETYFKIVSLGLIFNYIRFTITAAQRSIGNTRITLITNIIANLVNIFFNYCMIHGNLGFKEMGVQGAAIATLIGNGVAFVIALLSVYRSKGFLSIRIRDNWKINFKTWKNIFTVSSAAFVEQIFMRIGFFVIAKIVNELGTEQTAINAILGNIIALSFNIADGFAIGAAALVGQSLGEKEPNKAFAYGRISQVISVILAITLVIITNVFKVPLASAFSNDSNIINQAVKLLPLAAFVMLPQSIQWVTTGILRGAGDTKYTARTSMISVMIIRPIFSYTLCYIVGLGIIGSWIGMFVDQTIRCVFNNIRFINLKWMKINV